MTTTLRTLLGRPALVTVPDAELLTRYAADRDDVAFAELVHRHAPAVYAACRRFLSDPASLDDAFQAVFVLLSTKAGAIQSPDRLHGWLCGVSGRIARKLRDRNAKRSATERPLADVPEPATVERAPTDLTAVLDEELARLPPAYREVVRLCDVGGVSRRAAAKQLGIPHATLSNRLTRARAMLGTRLLRRGVALGAGLSLTSISIASVPAKLVSLTVSRIAMDAVPSNLITLASIGAYPVIPIKSAGVLLAALLLAGIALGPMAAGEPGKGRQPVQAKKPADPPEPDDPEPTAGGMVYGAAYSRDGKLLALTEAKDADDMGEHRVTVFDATTWKVLHHLSGPTDVCRGVAFTADGKTLFVACDDGAVYSWDTKTGKAGVKLEAKAGACGAVVLSPDGKLLATAHQDFRNKDVKPRLQLWDAATGKPVKTLENGEVAFPQTVTFSPDGKTVAGAYAAGSGAADKFHGVIEWDVESGKEVKRIDAPRITDGASPVLLKVAYTSNGKQIVLAGGEAVPVGNGCNCIGYLWVLDRKTGTVEKTLIDNARSDYVRQMTFSADGKKLYAGRISPQARFMNGRAVTLNMAEVQCWDTSTWEHDWSQVGEISHEPWALAVAPNGKRVGVSHTRGVDLLDAATGEKKGGLLARPK